MSTVLVIGNVSERGLCHDNERHIYQCMAALKPNPRKYKQDGVDFRCPPDTVFPILKYAALRLSLSRPVTCLVSEPI